VRHVQENVSVVPGAGDQCRSSRQGIGSVGAVAGRVGWQGVWLGWQEELSNGRKWQNRGEAVQVVAVSSN